MLFSTLHPTTHAEQPEQRVHGGRGEQPKCGKGGRSQECEPEACGQGRLKHVARQAGVLADHHAVAVLAAQEPGAGGLADLHRRGGGHHARVGLAPDQYF